MSRSSSDGALITYEAIYLTPWLKSRIAEPTNTPSYLGVVDHMTRMNLDFARGTSQERAERASAPVGGGGAVCVSLSRVIRAHGTFQCLSCISQAGCHRLAASNLGYNVSKHLNYKSGKTRWCSPCGAVNETTHGFIRARAGWKIGRFHRSMMWPRDILDK